MHLSSVFTEKVEIMSLEKRRKRLRPSPGAGTGGRQTTSTIRDLGHCGRHWQSQQRLSHSHCRRGEPPNGNTREIGPGPTDTILANGRATERDGMADRGTPVQ